MADIDVYPPARALPSVKRMRNQHQTQTPTTPLTPMPGTDRPAAGTARRGSASRRALTVVGAAVAALAVWLLAGPVLGIDLDVRQAPDSSTLVPVTASAVVISSVLAGLLGWALLALLERWGARGVIVWRSIAGAVALLSLGGPLSLAQSTGGAVVLALLHVVVAGVLLVALPRARSTAR